MYTIQRDCLWYKIMSVGVNGKMLDAIKSLYNDVKCAVKVNDMFSPWFNVSNGLKQGCKISTSLFSVYINDLVKEINDLNCGITIDQSMISLLIYADDIVLLAPSAENLQLMLNTVNAWCNKWRLIVNKDKTRIVHFRTPSVERCNTVFKCGENIIEYKQSYKYLGLWLNEHLNMTKTVSEITKSASRALSAMYTKCLRAGGMTLEVYKKLYESMVEPVLFLRCGDMGYRAT